MKLVKDVAEAIATKFNAEVELIEMPQSLKSQYQKYTCADISALLQHIEIEWTDITKYIHKA